MSLKYLTGLSYLFDPLGIQRHWRETEKMSSVLHGELRLSASGPLPVEDVWERYTQPVWWPRWAPHLREVDYPEPTVVPGTTGRVKGVGGVVATFRIEAVDEAARTWSWSVRFGPLRVHFEHGVNMAAPGSDQVSEAWLVMRAPWPVVLGYAPVARFSLSRLVSPKVS